MACSINYRTFATLLVVLLLVACATSPVDQGAIYYEQGLYDQAAQEWRPLANDGHYVAQHYMGALSRDGLGQTQLNLNDAANWFYQSAEQGYVPAMVSLAEVQTSLGNKESAEDWLILAARWGSIEAIEHLRQRGITIPEPDLYSQQLQDQSLEKLQATGSLMRPPIRKRN